jgi:hypothetical protein
MEIDFDLKKHFEAAVERVDAQVLDQALTPELRESAITQPRAALYARVQDALSRFRVDLIPGALADYKLALRERMIWERAFGVLKQPITPYDEMLRVAASGYFQRYLINGFEQKGLRENFEPGEQIDVHAPAFHVIRTNRREILRGSDFFDQNRPSGYSKSFWMSQCTPAAKLAEAEDMIKRDAEIRARPFSASSGPHAGLSTVIQR